MRHGEVENGGLYPEDIRVPVGFKLHVDRHGHVWLLLSDDTAGLAEHEIEVVPLHRMRLGLKSL